MGNKILKVIHKETKLEIYRETLIYHFIVESNRALVVNVTAPGLPTIHGLEDVEFVSYTLAEILLGDDFIVVLEQGGDLNKQSTEKEK